MQVLLANNFSDRMKMSKSKCSRHTQQTLPRSHCIVLPPREFNMIRGPLPMFAESFMAISVTVCL